MLKGGGNKYEMCFVTLLRLCGNYLLFLLQLVTLQGMFVRNNFKKKYCNCESSGRFFFLSERLFHSYPFSGMGRDRKGGGETYVEGRERSKCDAGNKSYRNLYVGL